jgi:uncharacterized membrane protein
MVAEFFLFIIRWLHIVAAVSWVGGAIFFWVVVRPILRAEGSSASIGRFIGPEFGQLVNVCMWVLILTGIVLAFDRLSQPEGTVTYAVILAVKTLIVAWMFFILLNRSARLPQREHLNPWKKILATFGHINMTVVLGVVVLALSDILRWVAET